MNERQRCEAEATQGVALGIAKQLATKGNLNYALEQWQSAGIFYQECSKFLAMAANSAGSPEAAAEVHILAAQVHERLAMLSARAALQSQALSAPDIRTARAILGRAAVSA